MNDAIIKEFKLTGRNAEFVAPSGKEQEKYYNSAGLGIPFSAVTRITRMFRNLYEDNGLFHPSVLPLSDYMLTECRQSVAELVGAKPEEIALTQNATEAIQGIILGMEFQHGDTILLGKREHPSLHLLTGNIERQGAKVVLVETDLSPYEQEVPQDIAFAAFSIVAYLSGKKLHPDWVGFLHDQKIPWLADATQAVGHIPVSIQELKCEFLVASGHKWLHAPIGTGFAYINHQSRKMLNYYPRAWKSVEYRDGAIFDRKNAVRFEKATQDIAPFAGLAVSAKWANSNEWYQLVEKRKLLASEFKKHFKVLEGIDLIHQCNGIIGIESKKQPFSASKVASICYLEGGWVIKAMDLAEFPYPALRISFSVNNQLEDTIKLAQFLNHILHKGVSP